MKYDIIGDIHGCFDELMALLEKLGYRYDNGIHIHPEGRQPAFVGDAMDRGPILWQSCNYCLHGRTMAPYSIPRAIIAINFTGS